MCPHFCLIISKPINDKIMDWTVSSDHNYHSFIFMLKSAKCSRSYVTYMTLIICQFYDFNNMNKFNIFITTSHHNKKTLTLTAVGTMSQTNERNATSVAQWFTKVIRDKCTPDFWIRKTQTHHKKYHITKLIQILIRFQLHQISFFLFFLFWIVNGSLSDKTIILLYPLF
jgi:hypothetical protein